MYENIGLSKIHVESVYKSIWLPFGAWKYYLKWMLCAVHKEQLLHVMLIANMYVIL